MESTRSYNGEFDNLKATELRLGLPGTDDEPKKSTRGGNKRTLDELNDDSRSETKSPEAGSAKCAQEAAPPAK